MVGVVQLVERQVVILNVAGSSPVTHPKDACRLGAAGSALTARGGSAHFELEPARLRRVADCTDGDTNHLPQDVAAEQSKLTANIATDAHVGSTTESFIHTHKAKSATGRWHGGAFSRRVGRCARELGC
jgi:hypothetical protein